MEQKKKNLKLLVIMVLLLVTAVSIYFIPKGRKTTLESVDLFQIQDTAAIDKVTISSAGLDNSLVRTDSGWVINKKFRADENIMMVLNTVMKKVEVLRPLPESQREEYMHRFDESGIRVAFYANDEKIKSFAAGANDTKSMSIFRDESDDFYVVNIPGYDSFVTGIFEITEIDWKDRLIVSARPMELNQMQVDYLNGKEGSFTVKVEGNFPLIPEVENLDTLALMDYLDQFQYFQADRFITSEETIYDSLSNTTPFVEITFDSYNDRRDQSIRFFNRLPGDDMILGLTGHGEKALFSHSRISGIFKKKGHFIKKPEMSRSF